MKSNGTPFTVEKISPRAGMPQLDFWLVGCFGLNDPLRQYFSLYRVVSQREGEREEKGQMRAKMSKQPHPHLLQEQ